MTVNKQKNWQAIVYSKMSNRTTGSWIEIIPRIQCMPLYDQLLCTLTTWHCFKHCWFTTGSWKKCFWHPWIFLYQQNGNPANINQYTSQCCVVGQLDSRPWQVHINVAKLTLQQWRLAHLTTACVKCVTTCKILVKKKRRFTVGSMLQKQEMCQQTILFKDYGSLCYNLIIVSHENKIHRMAPNCWSRKITCN